MKSIYRILLLALLSISLICTFAVAAMATDGEAESIPDGAAFKYTSAGGEVSYHAAEEFATKAKAGGTIQLLANIEVSSSITVAKSLTIDVNGFELRRAFYFGNQYKAVTADGGYTYTEEVYADAIANSANFFSVSAGTSSTVKNEFTLTSTTGSGTVYCASISANSWYNEAGELVKRDIVGYDLSHLVATGGKYANININGGLTIYGSNFIANGSGAHSSINVEIDNINYYTMTNNVGNTSSTYKMTFFIHAKSYVVVNVSNSVFYHAPSSGFVRFYNVDTTTTPSCFLKFTNCDIIKDNSTEGASITSKKEAEALVFDNCRVFDVGSSSSPAASINGTLGYKDTKSATKSSLVPAGSGFSNVDLAETVNITYTVPQRTAYTLDTESGDIQKISFDIPVNKTITLPFNVLTTKEVTVNWYNPDGSIARTDTVTLGTEELSAPDVGTANYAESDYMDIAYQWADATEGGKAVSSVIGFDAENGRPIIAEWKDVYNFYPVSELDGKVIYTPVLKYVRISLSYVGQFWIYIYLPYEEGMQAPAIDGKTLSSTVLIDGKKFYYNTYYLATSTVLDNKTRTVTFYDANETKYSKNITVGGLIYAEQVFANADYYAEELESVANMLRYSREAYELKSANDASVRESLEANGSRIDALIGTANADGSTTGGQYNLPAYVTEFENAPTVNVYDYSDYVYSIQFIMVGSSARVKITLTDAVEGMKVTKIYANGYSSGLGDPTTTKVTDPETGETVTLNAWYDKNQKVYNAVGKFEINILVPAHTDANGEEVAEKTIKVTYSMAEYITVMQRDYPETDIEIARAMYAFGVAAGDYVKNLTNY